MAELARLATDPESAPVIAYFAVLGGAFLVVLASVARDGCRLGGKGAAPLMAALCFALGALFVCWKAIFGFMMEQSVEVGCGPGESPAELLGCSTERWMQKDVFVQAYVDVTENLVGWASSSQLLMFVMSGCTFLHTKCRQRGVYPLVSLSYVIVGFLGAISLAFPILFAHLFLLAVQQKRPVADTPVARLSIPLALCNLAAMVGVVLLPLTYESHRRTVYTFGLLLVHFVLGLPCLVGRPSLVPSGANTWERNSARATLAAFYAFLAGASLLMHIHNVCRALLDLTASIPVEEALVRVFLGPLSRAPPFTESLCQYSISMDVVFTSIAAIGYMNATHMNRGIVCALLTPLLSVAVTFPTFLALGLIDDICTEQAAVKKKKA